MNLDYLFPPSVEKREHVAKQEVAPSHAPFSKREKVCGTVPSAAGFLPITATLQATSHYVTFLLVLKKKNPTSVTCIITSDECPPKTNKKTFTKTHSEIV